MATIPAIPYHILSLAVPAGEALYWETMTLALVPEFQKAQAERLVWLRKSFREQPGKS
jgi:hypothetical protein